MRAIDSTKPKRNWSQRQPLHRASCRAAEHPPGMTARGRVFRLPTRHAPASVPRESAPPGARHSSRGEQQVRETEAQAGGQGELEPARRGDLARHLDLVVPGTLGVEDGRPPDGRAVQHEPVRQRLHRSEVVRQLLALRAADPPERGDLASRRVYVITAGAAGGRLRVRE